MWLVTPIIASLLIQLTTTTQFSAAMHLKSGEPEARYSELAVSKEEWKAFFESSVQSEGYEHAGSNAMEDRSGWEPVHKKDEGKTSHLKGFADHFSEPGVDHSLYLGLHYRDLASQLSKSLNISLGYTYTDSPFFQLLPFASDPKNQMQLQLIDPEREAVWSEKYIQPRKRKDGEGTVGKSVVFSGWRVRWQGVRFEVWIATYFSPYFGNRVQSHIMTYPSLASPKSEKPSPLLAEELIRQVSTYSSRIDDQVLVFDSGYWKGDHEMWKSVQKASWEDVVLEETFKKSLQHEYKSFFESEEIYRELGVPWKRGIIFLGPPGNGKTITVKAIMKTINATSLYVRSFKSWRGDEAGITEIFERARAESPCLLIFEDLDSMITEENRSFFLNTVDGLGDNDGLLMLASTNHFDKLDPAISNRPSRFDRKYVFPNPKQADRRQYAVYWQDKLRGNRRIPSFPDELLNEFAEKTNDFSYAYMKESFVSTLLLLAADETHKLEFGKTLLNQVESLRKELNTEAVKAVLSVDGIKQSQLIFGRGESRGRCTGIRH